MTGDLGDELYPVDDTAPEAARAAVTFAGLAFIAGAGLLGLLGLVGWAVVDRILHPLR